MVKSPAVAVVAPRTTTDAPLETMLSALAAVTVVRVSMVDAPSIQKVVLEELIIYFLDLSNLTTKCTVITCSPERADWFWNHDARFIQKLALKSSKSQIYAPK